MSKRETTGTMVAERRPTGDLHAGDDSRTQAAHRRGGLTDLSVSPAKLQELSARAKVVMATSIAYVRSPSFSREVEGFEAGAETAAHPLPASRFRFLKEMPPHLARMCERPLLTQEGEQTLFGRMNFHKFRADQLRQLIDADYPDESLVAEVESHLTEAASIRDQIIESNMRLVISIIKKFVNAQNTFDDLLSEGIVSLIRAVENFDHSRGFRFSTYATQVIRRNTFHLISRRQRETTRFRNGASEVLGDALDAQNPDLIGEHQFLGIRSRIATMLDQLDRRERMIIRCRFALGTHHRSRTFQELADRLGISKERVRQLEQRAIGKLRGLTGEVELNESSIDPIVA